MIRLLAMCSLFFPIQILCEDLGKLVQRYFIGAVHLSHCIASLSVKLKQIESSMILLLYIVYFSSLVTF